MWSRLGCKPVSNGLSAFFTTVSVPRNHYVMQGLKMARFLKHTKYAHIRKDRIPPLVKYMPYMLGLKGDAKYEVVDYKEVDNTIPAPTETFEYPVFNLAGESKGTVQLLNRVFKSPLRKDILQRVVEYHRAKRRTGRYKSKDRSEVAGTGKKHHRQKGTGLARAGDRRPPHWRGGGASHGPVVRSFAIKIQRKVRKLAIMTVLSAKLAEGRLKIVENFDLPSHKTGALVSLLAKSNLDSVIFVDDMKVPPNFSRAVRNIPRTQLMNNLSVTTYDILRFKNIVLTTAAVKALTLRLTTQRVSPTDSRTPKKRLIEQERMKKHEVQMKIWRDEMELAVKENRPVHLSPAL